MPNLAIAFFMRSLNLELEGVLSKVIQFWCPFYVLTLLLDCCKVTNSEEYLSPQSAVLRPDFPSKQAVTGTDNRSGLLPAQAKF